MSVNKQHVVVTRGVRAKLLHSSLLRAAKRVTLNLTVAARVLAFNNKPTTSIGHLESWFAEYLAVIKSTINQGDLTAAATLIKGIFDEIYDFEKDVNKWLNRIDEPDRTSIRNTSAHMVENNRTRIEGMFQ